MFFWDLGRVWAPFRNPLRDCRSIVYRNLISDTLFRGTSAEYTDDTSDEGAFPLHSDLSHLGPERNLAVGNIDPLRARRRPGRV